MGCELSRVKPTILERRELTIHKPILLEEAVDFCAQKDDAEISPLESRHFLCEPDDIFYAKETSFGVGDKKNQAQDQPPKILLHNVEFVKLGTPGVKAEPNRNKNELLKGGLNSYQKNMVARDKMPKLSIEPISKKDGGTLLELMSPPSLGMEMRRERNMNSKNTLGSSPEKSDGLRIDHSSLSGIDFMKENSPRIRSPLSGVNCGGWERAKSKVIEEPVQIDSAMRNKKESGDRFYSTVVNAYKQHKTEKKNELTPTNTLGINKDLLLSKAVNITSTISSVSNNLMDIVHKDKEKKFESPKKFDPRRNYRSFQKVNLLMSYVSGVQKPQNRDDARDRHIDTTMKNNQKSNVAE